MTIASRTKRLLSAGCLALLVAPSAFCADPRTADEGAREGIKQLNALRNEHSFIKAQLLLEKLEALYKDDPDVRVAGGKLYTDMGLYSRADAEFKLALRIHPYFADADVALSQLNLQRLNTPAALEYARQAYRAAPRSPDAAIALAFALIASSRLREAEQEVSKVLLNYPRNADAQYAGYKLAVQRGKLPDARTRLEEALRITPNRADWLIDLSEVYKAIGDYTSAQNCLDRALSLEPYNIDGLDKMAVIQEFYFRDYTRAISYYKRILAVDSDSLSALAGLDRCKVKKNDLAGILKFELQNFIGSTFNFGR